VNGVRHIEILPSDGTGKAVWIKHTDKTVVDFETAEVRELKTLSTEEGSSTSPLTTNFKSSARCNNAQSCFHVSHREPVRRSGYHLNGEG
jgi:hypothetical protein